MRTTRAIATLDLILSPEREHRYYSYNSAWASGQQMASMRDGSGDEWFLLFLDTGWCGLKGLAHESEATQVDGLAERVRKVVPSQLGDFSNEPAFAWDDTSFCYWYDPSCGRWNDGVVAAGFSEELGTGAEDLLRILRGNPADYCAFAEEYFEVIVPPEAVKDIYERTPLTPKIVSALNPQADMATIAAQIWNIGYPRG